VVRTTLARQPNLRIQQHALAAAQGDLRAARGQFDPKVTPEERPAFQPWALAKIKSMTPTELELSKSSVNCMPRGLPAIWLQNPYSTMLVHTPTVLAQLYEVLNNWRIIHLDGRPVPKNPEPWFHGTSSARWEGDTLVVDTTNFLDRTNYEWASIWTRPSETLHLVERFTRIDVDTIEYKVTVEDPATFSSPWTAVIPILRLADDTQIYEYACHEGNYAMPNLLSAGRADAARRQTSSR